MTAAAIGSGAAGGTLTPAMALGATLGAILGVPPVGVGVDEKCWENHGKSWEHRKIHGKISENP